MCRRGQQQQQPSPPSPRMATDNGVSKIISTLYLHESYPELAVRPLLETENRIQYFLCRLRLTTFHHVVQGRIGNEDHLQQDTFLMVLKIYSTSNTMNISALRGCHKPASSEEAMLQNSQDTISLMRFFVFVVLKDVFTMPLSSQNLSDAMKLDTTQSAH